MLNLLRDWFIGKPVIDVPEKPFTDEEIRAAELGAAACRVSDTKNPFSPGTARHAAWQSGWDDVEFQTKAW